MSFDHWNSVAITLIAALTICFVAVQVRACHESENARLELQSGRVLTPSRGNGP